MYCVNRLSQDLSWSRGTTNFIQNVSGVHHAHVLLGMENHMHWLSVQSCIGKMRYSVKLSMFTLFPKLNFTIDSFSGVCYKRQMQPLSKNLSTTPFVRKPHSIRLVEIPAVGDRGQRGIKLSLETAQARPTRGQGMRISQ